MHSHKRARRKYLFKLELRPPRLSPEFDRSPPRSCLSLLLLPVFFCLRLLLLHPVIRLGPSGRGEEEHEGWPRFNLTLDVTVVI